LTLKLAGERGRLASSEWEESKKKNVRNEKRKSSAQPGGARSVAREGACGLEAVTTEYKVVLGNM
jgi:hypothetical protein